ncbi:hypothetical protein N1031_07035 [Herbiconiux moechotypicola]|uniref:Uncharacterized protein n=1 Tax=Herbiconiux moechotypicola TaxID=637393 RepID=A0ABP5QAS4_9MICO|nr:hypothetical protein [Herbiconiux moechotypicola]MCS5729511.1 hypothetical protein [Herbiconiux moechotypicola]
MTISTDLTPDVRQRPFLTVIPRRSPRQKTHVSLGYAKSAISDKVHYRIGAVCDMAVYEWRDEKWSLLWEIPRGTEYSALPWKESN